MTSVVKLVKKPFKWLDNFDNKAGHLHYKYFPYSRKDLCPLGREIANVHNLSEDSQFC